MTSLSAPASYNKKPGSLAVLADGTKTTWTAKGGIGPAVVFPIARITNLQQTPATSAKVSLRLVEFVEETKETKNHTFQFSADDTGRSQAGAIKDVLVKAIQDFKAPQSVPASRPEPKADGAPAAMAIAAAVSSGSSVKASNDYDDAKLLANHILQQKLLSANKQLGSTFAESMKARPSSISLAAFDRQFWSSRLKLLRAFAIQQDQKRGDYNVLATIHARTEGEELKLSITPEQVTLILSQYPVVRKAKSKLSTEMNNSEFWTRFFKSRLFKKLKGEKITDADKGDEKIDKFFNDPDDTLEREKKLLGTHIPHTIDLAGNEQDNSQRQGNAPDRDNRPTADRVPIMRALNALSERLVSQVAPSDVDASAPIGVDEATFKEMELRDLAHTTEAQRLILNIKDKAKFFATGKGTDESQIKRLFDKQNPQEVLKILRTDLSSSDVAGLEDGIGVNDSDSDDDMDDPQTNTTHVGSRASRRKATQQVFQSVKDRRAQANDHLAGMDEDEIASSLGLSPSTYHNITLTQATATVFLNHFWSVYHAGNAAQAAELQGVQEALSQTLDGINSAGDAAEKERKLKVDEMKSIYLARSQRTGKQLRFDPEIVKGGRKVIDQLMASTVRAIQFALETYKKALDLARREEAQSQ